MVSLRFPAAAPSVLTAGLLQCSLCRRVTFTNSLEGESESRPEGGEWMEGNLKDAGEIRGLTCELQISQTLSRAFKTFPTKWLLCVTVAASSRAADLENGPAVCRVFVDCG